MEDIEYLSESRSGLQPHVVDALVYLLTYGKSIKRSPEWNAFKNARARCINPNKTQYADWGGRGIQFRFPYTLEGFAQFVCAVGKRPHPDWELDRMDNDGHYELGNLWWVPFDIQVANRREYRSHKPKCLAFVESLIDNPSGLSTTELKRLAAEKFAYERRRTSGKKKFPNASEQAL